MESASRRILVVLGIAALAGIAYLVLAPREEQVDEPDHAAHDPEGQGEARTATGRSGRTETGARTAAGTTPSHEGAGGTRTPPSGDLSELREAVRTYSRLFRAERAAKDAGDAEQAAWEKAWRTATNRMRRRLRDPEEALAFLSIADSLGLSEKMATRMGRLLQRAAGSAVEAELTQASTQHADSRTRLIAVVGLEGRDAGVWLPPVANAYSKDASEEVRDAASRVLGRSLADPRHIRSHASIRRTIESELGSDDATARKRALVAMLADRNPSEDSLALARKGLRDPDVHVRHAAEATVRVLEQRRKAGKR